MFWDPVVYRLLVHCLFFSHFSIPFSVPYVVFNSKFLLEFCLAGVKDFAGNCLQSYLPLWGGLLCPVSVACSLTPTFWLNGNEVKHLIHWWPFWFTLGVKNLIITCVGEMKCMCPICHVPLELGVDILINLAWKFLSKKSLEVNDLFCPSS